MATHQVSPGAGGIVALLRCDDCSSRLLHFPWLRRVLLRWSVARHQGSEFVAAGGAGLHHGPV